MKNRILKTALVSGAVYTVVSLLFLCGIYLTVSDEVVKPVVGLLLSQLAALLIYSVVITASFGVFNSKLTKISARILHIAITYLATVFLVLVLAEIPTPATGLMYIFFTTVIFAAVYGASCFIIRLANKQ